MSDEDYTTLESQLSEVLTSQIENIVHLNLEFEGSCTSGAKLNLLIVSNVFTGLKPLARHKLVNKAIEGFLNSGLLHAVTIKAMDETSYEKSQTE